MNLLPAFAQSQRPRLLDLFCGAGGAAVGYYRAGFDVTGVDVAPQKNYPFRFIQADALDYAAAHGWRFDAIHASPPCQAHSWSARRWVNSGDREYADFLAQTRFWLRVLGLPYVIENVVGAPLIDPLWLDGRMFPKHGKQTLRRRGFESNILLLAPAPYRKSGNVKGREWVTVAGHGGDGSAKKADWQAAMGIDWMSKPDMAQAIPPVYTYHIGLQLMRAVHSRQALDKENAA